MTKNFLILILIFLPSLLFGKQFKTFSGKVVGVSDGDSIKVMRDGKVAKIRLHGIDCPESSQAFGKKAKKFTSDYCFGKVVRIESRSTGTDRFGRLIGEVFTTEKVSLNRALVKAGLAWWYRKYAANDKVLETLEKEARTAKRGLWADKLPIAPWEFRKAPQKRALLVPQSSGIRFIYLS